ncbi:MAG: pyridoxamine 5'-phosphate oxidase family protein [SAR324 cluster bacterium]|nr:pyridoxamine 5'-phosphate oxidase family protein [SAR324 cluster bacterium]
MNEYNQEELAHLEGDYHELLASEQTLLLSTVSEEGFPQISYAPCVRGQDGTFYIYISELAGHTANLMKNPQASIMFIRAESESNNLFARERAVFECSVSEIMRGEENYQKQLQHLEEKFGGVIKVLRGLADFHLFALKPENGRFVAGFGKAFSIETKSGRLEPITADQLRGS